MFWMQGADEHCDQNVALSTLRKQAESATPQTKYFLVLDNEEHHESINRGRLRHSHTNNHL